MKIAWQRTFVSTMCVTECLKQRVKWCRVMCVYVPVFREDMDAERAEAGSLRWIETDKGDAGEPNYRPRLVVREIKKAKKKSNLPSAAELFSGMPLESVTGLRSLSSPPTVKKRRKASEPLQCTTSAGRIPWSTRAKSVCELPDEKERLAREKGHDLEYVGLLYGTVDARMLVGKRNTRRS